MAFNGSEGGTITLAAGAVLTAAFRNNFPTQIKGRFFGKDKLNQIDIANRLLNSHRNNLHFRTTN